MTVRLIPPPELLTFKMYPKVEVAPDKSDMQALTGYRIGYSNLKHHGRPGNVGVTLTITVEFVQRDSWVLREHQQARLLEHERVHYMLAACGGHRMHKQRVAATDISESAANARISSLLAERLSLVDAVSTRYDGETENGNRAGEQALWKARVQTWYRNKTLDYSR